MIFCYLYYLRLIFWWTNCKINYYSSQIIGLCIMQLQLSKKYMELVLHLRVLYPVCLLKCTTSDRHVTALSQYVQIHGYRAAMSAHCPLSPAVILRQVTALGMRVKPLLTLCIVLMSAYCTLATWCMVSHVPLGWVNYTQVPAME